MPIELPCSQCGQPLRVGDESAGLQARCPSCGVVTNIPASSTARFADRSREPAAENPYASPGLESWNQTENPARLPTYRGAVVLALGILSVVCFPLLGPVAWIIGYNDLKRMRVGERAAEDEAPTRAGMILGMISSSFLLIIAAGCAVVYVLTLLTRVG